MSGSSGEQVVVGAVVGGLIVFYLAPTVLAFGRGHAYRWVIAAINLAVGWTLLGWLACTVWAIWPRERALAEPLIGNPIGTGKRTLGAVIGEGLAQSQARTSTTGGFDAATLERIRRLVALREAGALSADEFKRERDVLVG